jgi:hypothetical protein
MKKLVIASGLCMAVSGCIGFSWTSKVDDGAIYELNREMYIAEEDGLILVDARTEHPVYCTIKGTLPAGTKLQEALSSGFYFLRMFGKVVRGFVRRCPALRWAKEQMASGLVRWMAILHDFNDGTYEITVFDSLMEKVPDTALKSQV